MSEGPVFEGDAPDWPRHARSDLEQRAAALDDVVCAELEASWASLRRLRTVFDAERHNREAVARLGSIAGREVERRSFLAQLALTLRVPEARVHALIAQARMLFEHLPLTVDRVREGSVSYAQAVVIAEEAGSLPDEVLDAFDDRASALAEGRTVSQLRRRVRVLRDRLHPESLEVRHSAAFESRSVWTEPGRDGMGALTACLSNADLALIEARLDATARAMRFGHAPEDAAPGSDARSASHAAAGSGAGPVFSPELTTSEGWDEARTIAQLRADVLRDLLLTGQSPTTGTGIPTVTATVLLTVPVLTLLDHDSPTGTQGAAAAGVGVAAREPAMLEGVGPIDAATARRLVADAPGLTRILTHPETGAILSFGRDTYRISAALRRYLRLRDGSCTFPGCNRKAAACDIDHADDWALGGCTDADNLAHLCRGHHTLKHHAGWHTTPPGSPPERRDDSPSSADPATQPSGHAAPRRWRAPTGDHFVRPPESALPGADPPF